MINLTIRFKNKEAMEEWIDDQDNLANLSIDGQRVNFAYRPFDSIDQKAQKEHYVLTNEESV